MKFFAEIPREPKEQKIVLSSEASFQWVYMLQEGIDTWGGFHAEILKEPIKWENGYIIPPSKPGLGVELNDKVLAKYANIQSVK